MEELFIGEWLECFERLAVKGLEVTKGSISDLEMN